MKRALGRFDLTCLGLNAIVGSGIFLLPDDLFRLLGPYSPLAFFLCALGLLPVALCFAEAARRVDQDGGPALYAERAWGARVGFVVGWMCYSNALCSFAAVSAAAAASFTRVAPGLNSKLAELCVALAIIAAFAVLNVRGARPSAWVVDGFTVAKFGVLALVLAALLPSFHVSVLVQSAAQAPVPSFDNLSAATFIAVFAAQGFEVVPVPAGEARSPRRHVPVALLVALGAASGLYVIVQGVLVSVHPALAAPSDTPVTDAVLRVAPAFGGLVAWGAIVSTLGFVSGSAFGTPRYLFATARSGILPAWLAFQHPRFGSPHRAILVTAGLAAALVSAFDYRKLIGISNVAVAVQYLATCLAVLVFRRREGRSGWRAAPIPLLGVAVSSWIATEASGQELLWASGLLFAGGLVYSAVSLARART